MDTLYDIFKKLRDGPVWIESVTGLERSKERLAILNKTAPGEYYAYDIREARIVARVPGEPKSNSNADRERQANATAGKPHKGLSYEVFMRNEKGERVWVETVFGLDALEGRLMKLASLKPGIYMVYDPGERKFIEPFRKTA